MTKFTKGPWVQKNDSDEDVVWVEDSIGQYICDLYHIADKKVFTKENAIANSHLIAAAPDLYEALELANKVLIECSQFLDCMDLETDMALRKNDMALAKARGEPNE